jgi:hypothetical protein
MRPGQCCEQLHPVSQALKPGRQPPGRLGALDPGGRVQAAEVFRQFLG